MKILQIIPNFGMGGAETMCENLCYELRKRGHEVIVVSLYDTRSAITDRLEASGADLRYLGKTSGFDLGMLHRLRRLVKAEKPDVIHTHLYALKYAVLASVFTKCKKRVHTVHNMAEKECSGSDQKLSCIFFRRGLVVPVALSPEIRGTITALYGLRDEKVPVVYNGIDLSRCSPKASYERGDVFRILHIGRFFAQKNHIGLVRAFECFHKEHADSELCLIGDGELRREIEAYVGEHGLTDAVRFLGLQPNVYGFLSDADLFTLPSSFEGVPMTLIEAMGTALPIVATAVGGVPDMLDGESAWLVPCEEGAVAEAFSEAYLDSEKREKRGTGAFLRSKRFSVEEMASSYLAIYETK